MVHPHGFLKGFFGMSTTSLVSDNSQQDMLKERLLWHSTNVVNPIAAAEWKYHGK